MWSKGNLLDFTPKNYHPKQWCFNLINDVRVRGKMFASYTWDG